MTQLTFVVRPFRAEAILAELCRLGVEPGVVREAKGYSRQKGHLERYVGGEYGLAFIPKVEILVWVEESRRAEVEEAVLALARTGRIGDGKVFAVATSWPHVVDF